MEIIDKNILMEAIIEYQNLGRELMQKLGLKYDLDIYKIEDYEKLISRSNKSIPRKGALSKRWNYSFHGGECGFYNKKHQQSVEVILNNSPLFGDLDTYFVMNFLNSTKKYKDSFKNLKWLDLKPIMQEMGISVRNN